MEAASNQDNDYIIIPNPIYDVVFRYLMADYESAVIVLSTLINEKILQLHLEPLTHPIKAGTVKDPRTDDDVSLFHLDFTATIQLVDGTEELIMIELQKAAEPTDIFRFKRYISKNFQHKRLEEITHHKSQAITVVERPIRLIPIFILNFRIENEINDLLIKVNRSKLGVFKNEVLQKHNDFIDNLSYDMLVVQLPNLRNIQEEEYQQDEYKQKLYALLKLFDQKERFKNNEHRLRVMRKLLPGFLERVVARLQAADKDNPDLEESMLAEDEILKLLLARDNEIALVRGQLDQAKEELDKKNEIIFSLAQKLKSSGTPTDEIAILTGLSLDQIKVL